MGQKIKVYSVHSLFSEVFFSSSEERWVLGQCSNNAFSINAPRFTAGGGGGVNTCECKQQTRLEPWKIERVLKVTKQKIKITACFCGIMNIE